MPNPARKTSLLQASVIPTLKERKRVQVLPIARVSGDLPRGVSGHEVGNIFVYNTLLSLAGAGASRRRSMRWPVRRVGSLSCVLAGDDRPQPALLIVDQFEEIFTLYRSALRPGRFLPPGAGLSGEQPAAQPALLHA